jgi:hypothetical protein
MTKTLDRHPRKASRARIKRAHKGWSPERRAKQAELIRTSKPWLKSTGPRTEEGKARAAPNALKHGFRSRAFIERVREERQLIHDAGAIIALAKIILRTVESRSMRVPHITVWTGDPETDGGSAPGSPGGGPSCIDKC